MLIALTFALMITDRDYTYGCDFTRIGSPGIVDAGEP